MPLWGWKGEGNSGKAAFFFYSWGKLLLLAMVKDGGGQGPSKEAACSPHSPPISSFPVCWDRY